MKNFNSQLNMEFKKYILFPISTFIGAIFSAFVILCSSSAAIIFLTSGGLFLLLTGNRRRIS
jgi:hypothetical protein